MRQEREHAPKGVIRWRSPTRVLMIRPGWGGTSGTSGSESIWMRDEFVHDAGKINVS